MLLKRCISNLLFSFSALWLPLWIASSLSVVLSRTSRWFLMWMEKKEKRSLCQKESGAKISNELFQFSLRKRSILEDICFLTVTFKSKTLSVKTAVEVLTTFSWNAYAGENNFCNGLKLFLMPSLPHGSACQIMQRKYCLPHKVSGTLS